MKYPETEIAKRSLTLFGIAGTIRRVATGLDVTYRVKTNNGQVFALRVSGNLPIRQLSAFRVEAEWIDALSCNQWFCVPRVQRTEKGELVGQAQDANGVTRASTLLSWLPGRRCFRPGNEHAHNLGQMAGALHQHAQSFVAPPADAIKSWDARLMCFMPHNPQDGLSVIAPEAAEKAQKVYLHLEGLVATLDAHEIGLINADLGLHNVLWYKGQAGLVDFNDAGIGPYAFCLARLAARMRLHENGQALVEELLNGYREVMPVPSAYEKWGSLFELAAELFRLNYGAKRAVHRGTPLRESEQHIINTLDRKLKYVGL
ncbi:MAG: phosphotransferase [Chloroflexota bacterium]